MIWITFHLSFASVSLSAYNLQESCTFQFDLSVCLIHIFKKFPFPFLVCQAVKLIFWKTFPFLILVCQSVSQLFSNAKCLSFWSVSLSDSYFQIFHIFHFGLSVCQPAISKIQCLSFWSVSLSDSYFQKFHIFHFGLSVCQPAISKIQCLSFWSVSLSDSYFKFFTFFILVCQSV